MYHDYSLCPECHRWISGITLQHAQKIGDIVTCIHCNKHIVLNKLENVTGEIRSLACVANMVTGSA